MLVFRLILLVTGVAACASAPLMIKAAQSHPMLIAAWRMLIAGTMLMPLFAHARRRYPAYPLRDLLGLTWPAAVLLSLHFWSWNIGVHRTLIANATLVVNMVAPVMPALIWLVTREHARKRELAGTAVAFAGTIWLVGADYRFAPENVVGDMICFGSMLALASYMAWSRRNRQLPSIWLYVPPVYLLGGLMCLAAGGLTTGSLFVAESREWLLIAGLAFVPTLFGHSILNYSMQRLRSQLVAVVTLGQFIPASALAWWLFDETPQAHFPVACVLVVGGALIVLHAQMTEFKPQSVSSPPT